MSKKTERIIFVIVLPSSMLIGVVGYALRYIESEEDKEVRIHVGFDDEMAIRFNEDQVLRANHPNGFSEETLKARLRKGGNRILIKLSNSDNTNWKLWAFSFRIEE